MSNSNSEQSNSIDPCHDPTSPYYIHLLDNLIINNITQFDGKGFVDWKRFMLIAHSATNKLAFVDCTITKPTTA